MYSTLELLAFGAALSLAAAFMAYRQGRKNGFHKGYNAGNNAHAISIIAQLTALGIDFKVVDGSECLCPVCVAERAEAKKP